MHSHSTQYYLEELVNSLTHGLGAILSVAGLIALVAMAAARGKTPHLVGCTVFGVSLVLLYTASTLYHAFHGPDLKRILRIIDHSCIYVLIAGTYTPFA
ncbi:hemolysin III family protein, partial [Candidatus Sumerlaeota bacterium]|nr:hemolysin III family protein [Candidatus Sumerlaeota bacterium]